MNIIRGMGDWGLGFGDWGLGPTPNPQSPIPNPQSPLKIIMNKNDNNIHKKVNSKFTKNITFLSSINIKKQI